MKVSFLLVLLVLLTVASIEARKTSRSRSSSSARGSSRRTNYQPTSLSNPQPSAPKPAPKPSLFGWQEKPVQKSHSYPANKQSQQSQGQSHSYPSSQTGLSGGQPKQPTNHQQNTQGNSAPHSYPVQSPAQTQINNQPSHAYPSSNGLSGNSGAGYPKQQGTGLSGTGTGAGQQPNPAHNGQHYPTNNMGNNNQYHNPQGPPPPYSPPNHNAYGGQGYGYNAHNPGYGGHPHNQGYGYNPQTPGYFGNYGNRGFGGGGGMSRTGTALAAGAGASVGTLITGLALWNLVRSTGQHRHTVIYDNRGQPIAVAPQNTTEPVVDPMLADLVNCSLTISSTNSTEVLAIPCSIATSFSPDADVKESGSNVNANEDTKCIVSVLNKSGKEFMTTIPCSILLSTAAENNVTEPPPLPVNETDTTLNFTTISPSEVPVDSSPTALKLSNQDTDIKTTNLDCTPEIGDLRDPINPCFAVTQNLTVVPLQTTEAA